MEGRVPRTAVHDDKITHILFSQELSGSRLANPVHWGGSQVVRVILRDVIIVRRPPRALVVQQGWLTLSPAARSAAHASFSRPPPQWGAGASGNS